MMKYVFVLALLHLCVSAKSDANLYKEIIDRLTKLKKNVTSVSELKAPRIRGSYNPVKCLGTIQKELGDLLNNVTVPPNVQHVIPELKGNLNALGEHKVNDECKMRQQKPKVAVGQYIIFFQKLNTFF